MGLWFGVVLPTRGISDKTGKFLSLLSRADTEPKLPVLLTPPARAGSAQGSGHSQDSWPQQCCRVSHVTLSTCRWTRRVRGMLGVMLFVFPRHCSMWSPAVLGWPWAEGMNSLLSLPVEVSSPQHVSFAAFSSLPGQAAVGTLWEQLCGT